MSLPTAQTGAELLQVGAFFLRDAQLFQITAWNPEAPLELEARALADSTLHGFSLTDLFAPTPLTRFGASVAALLEPAASVAAPPVEASGLPTALLSRATAIIQTVETVERHLIAIRQRWRLEGTSGSLRAATREVCTTLPQPISLSQYYTYRQLYRLHGGDHARIAASRRRSTYQKSQVDPNAQHFVDTIVSRFYRSTPPLRAQTVYHLLYQLWTHTWTDGILREVMILILDACVKGLAAGHDRLTLDTLRWAWQDIKRAKMVSFLDYLRTVEGG